MTDPAQPASPRTPEQRRAEAVAWYQSWREQASTALLPPARALTDEEVNALVRELR